MRPKRVAHESGSDQGEALTQAGGCLTQAETSEQSKAILAESGGGEQGEDST